MASMTSPKRRVLPDSSRVRPNDRENEGGIEVRWGTEAESAVDHDTGVADLARYRVYRQATSRAAPWVVVADGDWNNFAEAAEQAGTYGVTIPAGRFYVDYTVTPGEEYWYCVVAVDDGTQNWEIPGDVLESTRWWTWSGYSYAGCVAPEGGTDASLAQPGQFALSQKRPEPVQPDDQHQLQRPDDWRGEACGIQCRRPARSHARGWHG